jgi:multidrug efflux pump subunit AcrA (membrane-fusion protein)
MRRLVNEGAVAQADLDQAIANLRVAQADLASAREAATISQRLEQEQQQQLTVQQEVNSAQQQQQLTQLQGQLQLAQLQYDQALRQLEQLQQQGIAVSRNGVLDFQTVIRATQDGVVVGVPVSAGDQIYTGTTLTEMSQIDRLIVEVPVSSRLVNSLQVDQGAVIQIGTDSNSFQMDGRIVSINPLPSDDFNHLVKVQFSNPNDLLLVGQPAKVHFSSE